MGIVRRSFCFCLLGGAFASCAAPAQESGGFRQAWHDRSLCSDRCTDTWTNTDCADDSCSAQAKQKWQDCNAKCEAQFQADYGAEHPPASATDDHDEPPSRSYTPSHHHYTSSDDDDDDDDSNHSSSASEDDDRASTDTPLISQECSNWCFAASINMAASTFGHHAENCQIVSAARGMNCCQLGCQGPCNQQSGPPLVITALLQTLGAHGGEAEGPLDESTLRKCLKKGSPVIAVETNIQQGHGIVIVGYERTQNGYLYEVNDPEPMVGKTKRPYAGLLNYSSLPGQSQAFPWRYTWIVTS